MTQARPRLHSTSALRSQLLREAGERLVLLLNDPAAVEAERARGHRGLMAMVKVAVVNALLAHEQADGVASVPALPTSPDAVFPDQAARAAASAWMGELEDLQAETGLFSSGDNLASPPDSAFTITDVALVVQLLREGEPWFPELAARLEHLLGRALPALTTGGIHTPNHRWEISGALSRGGALLGNDAALDRAREWLTEGVDVDADGIYSERSPNYSAHVSNPSLLTMAEVLDRPDLLEIVHLNLHAQLDLTSPQGDLETTYSRRQDQKSGPFPLGPYLPQFARFAPTCQRCAGAVPRVARAPHRDAVETLTQALLVPAVAEAIGSVESEAADGAAAVSDDVAFTQGSGQRWFSGIRLLRRWNGRDWASVYGGSDVPASGRIASGLACNPTFLRFALGGVEISSVRLSRDFFGLGPFRAARAQCDEASSTVVLNEELAAGYYQPLPADLRRPDGAYDLQFEGRFAAAMTFSQREVDLLHLNTEVSVQVSDEVVSLSVTTTGPVASHALELALPADAEVSGAVDLGDGRFCLEAGDAVVTSAGRALRIGPGAGGGARLPAEYHPGEAYTFLGGTDAVGGKRLYLTWASPGTTAITVSAI